MIPLRPHFLLAGMTASPLRAIDWIIVGIFIIGSVLIALALSRRARKNTSEYFITGGAMPWWLLGTSMVATTFASDTPLVLSGWVVTSGISQNWFWWCQVPVTIAGVYFFAALWKRTRVLTDMEFVALRYSGPSAQALRGFKALWLAIPFTCIIMGWVNKALTKIISLTIPVFPRVPGLDAALEWLYLRTPVSSGLDPAVKAALRAGEINAYDVYHAAAGSGASVGLEDLARLGTYLEHGVDGGVIAETFRLGTFLGSGAAASADPLTLIHSCGLFVTGLHELKILFLLFIITFLYTMISGLWGVMVTDFVQFWIAMGGTILLAVLAVNHPSIGGMDALLTRMSAIYSPDKTRAMLAVVPAAQSGGFDLMPWRHFLILVTMAWWATGFTDGGSSFAQRMLSAKSERHAALGYLWFAVAHFALRMWPWIAVGFVAAVMFPYVQDPLTGLYPGVAIAENGYIKVMLAVLPPGLLGLLIAAFFAAYMSTISTQVNLSASYLLNDFYRPFIRKNASEKHYVRMSMAFTALVGLLGIISSLFITTIEGAWFLVAALSSGIGAIYLLRWYWHRINAWTEISCIATLIVLVLVFKKFDVKLFGGEPIKYPDNLLLTVPISFAVSMLVTFLTRPVERAALLEFYRRVQPGGLGWRAIEREIRAQEPGFRARSPLTRENAGVAILSVAVVYCFLFGIGKVIIGNALYSDPALTLFGAGGMIVAAGAFVLLYKRGNMVAGWAALGSGAAMMILGQVEALRGIGLGNRAFGFLLIALGLGMGWIVASHFSEKQWKE